jgi:hypothetical protein
VQNYLICSVEQVGEEANQPQEALNSYSAMLHTLEDLGNLMP